MFSTAVPRVSPMRCPAVAPPARNTVVITCSASQRGADTSEMATNQTSHRSRELPNGQGWLLDDAASGHDVLYSGQDFVITRQRRNPCGLVRRPGAHVQHLRRKQVSGNLALALAAMQQQTGMVPFGFSDRIGDSSVIIDVVIEDSETGSDGAATAGSVCLGIVPYQPCQRQQPGTPSPDEEEWVVETSSDNPRRTQKVKFTCNLCGCTTISPVNPHAMAKGSVFARCGGCNVIHKLKDNLKLFLEVSGPVYGKPRPQVRMPAGVTQFPGRGLHGSRIGGFDLLKGTDDKR